jgi:S1-C subfamily serine protease
MKTRMSTGRMDQLRAGAVRGGLHTWGCRALGGALCVLLALGARLALTPDRQVEQPTDVDLARSVSRTYEVVTAGVAPGVVSIAAYQTRGGLPVVLGHGSGVVIRADGVIVTNAHVVTGADVLRVTFHDGDTVGAELLGADQESNLAVVRVPRRGLAALELRLTPDPRVGEAVLAVGNPLGLGHTVTAGIVSGLGRAIGVATYEDFLQTDAAIHSGNSGGPLVDLAGRVLGISTAVANADRGGQGIGFAIPARMVREVAAQLEASGSVTRGYLGVKLALVDQSGGVPRVGPGEFVGVEFVYPGSPAEQAGIRAGDIVATFGTLRVESVAELLAIVARSAPGATIELGLRRKGAELVLPVLLGARPQQ